VRSRFAGAILCLLVSALGVAQTVTPQQMMGYFAGDWSLSGTAKVSPNSPSAPYRSTQHGEFVGSGFLEIHSVSHGPLGDVHGVRMMEYNAADQVFTMNMYNSLGEHQLGTCKPDGAIWVWDFAEKMNGVAASRRETVTLLSPNSYRFKSEVQKPDGSWATVMEATATRSGAK
jgi:hypothetical protein